ncbi:hypothetical protein [Argonema galeatum]|uniref:hypothetical protein n=1 Tax=Argonema galeatum TaxID=2942762 RepID=UPI002010D45C|nr:hypothetical protein [Argonema galeatum]MCL1465322.1 hypothetical protein [Argonema galeatum A003/A1]
MKSELIKLTYQVQLQAGEKLNLPASLVESLGAGDWSITIEKINTMPETIRNHDAFLNSYAPEDEGLYDDYPGG